MRDNLLRIAACGVGAFGQSGRMMFNPAIRLRMSARLLCGAALLAGPHGFAQTGEIVVTAKMPGSVAAEVPQAPIATFDEEDIQAYGVTSISDLLAAISPETNSGRGRGGSPIILVNGVRIASFRELRDYPPESIRRIEVLPEEVSLRYGFPPDQRVVNLILKDHFDAKTAEAEASTPQDGGGSVYDKFHATTISIDRGKRLNIAAETDHTTPLTEAARGITTLAVPTVAGDPNPAAYDDLVADQVNSSLNATWTLPVGVGAHSGTLAINGTVTEAKRLSLSGLNTASSGAVIRSFPGALASLSRTRTLQAGASLNKPVGDWQFSATVDGTSATTTTHTDQRGIAVLSAADATGPLPDLVPGGTARTLSTSNAVSSLATLIGHPARLPGGQVSLTVKAGFGYNGQISNSSLNGLGDVRLNRGDAQAGVNLGIPVTSRRDGFGAALGDITLNVSAGADRLSDDGTIANWSGGVTWGLTDRLNLQASFINSQTAPSLAALGGPVMTASNVPVYDFASGKTFLVTALSGGNPALLREGEHDIKLGANWSLPFLANSTLIAEYFNNRSSNLTSGFPALTPVIEASFASRITRDGAGNITAIDMRLVNLASSHEVRLRWGINLFGNIGAPLPPVRGNRLMGLLGGGGGPPRGFGGGGPDGPPPGGGFGGGGGDHGGDRGGFGGGRVGDRGGDRKRYPGRWNLSVYHTVQFVDRVVVAPGLTPLDLLGGDALSSGGGVARQSIEVDGGGFYKGLGLRLAGTWTGPSHVNPIGAPAASDLRFGALAQLRMRLFADLGQQAGLVKAVPFLRGARMSLMVNNILNARQKVTDGAGQTPPTYQPFYEDPLGRVFGAELRKLF